MESTVGLVKAYLINEKIFPNTSVTIGFKYPCNWFVLQKLIRGQPCSCIELAYASETTCTAYSIYESIKEVLMGSPLEQLKSKISSMSCNYQNDEFLISFNCSNSLTVVKKNLAVAMSKFTPHKYYAKYSHNIKLLNGKPHKKEYMYCANLLKNVPITAFIIGKITTSKEKFDASISKVFERLKPVIIVEGERSRNLDKYQGVTDYPTVKTSSYNSVFIKDFVKSETGVTLAVHSKLVIIYNKQWNSVSKKITTKHIDKYVEKKYAKLEDKFIPMMLYMASSDCSLDTQNLIKLHKASPTTNDVAKLLKSAF